MVLIAKNYSAVTVLSTSLNALYILSYLISITIIEVSTNIMSFLQIRKHTSDIG